MKNQRGNIYFILVGTLAVLAMLGYAAHWLLDRGRAEVRAEWAEANRIAEAFERGRQRYAEQIAKEAAAKHVLAERQRDDYYEQLQREKANRRKNGTPLYVVPGCTADGFGEDPKLPPSAAPKLRLTYEFVREWDAGWTDLEGKPVFGIPGGVAEGSLGAGSPLTLDDALDNQTANAKRCSADRAQLKRLVTLIRKLRADWGKTAPGP